MTHAVELRAAYDDAALEGFDVLLTPANPTVGPKHLGSGESVMEKNDLVLGNTWTTCPFNLTGHPGLVIPVGWSEVEGGGRLPVGMQLVGKR